MELDHVGPSRDAKELGSQRESSANEHVSTALTGTAIHHTVEGGPFNGARTFQPDPLQVDKRGLPVAEDHVL